MSSKLGVILAGGLSRRMGGGDKCLREIEGVTLLDRVLSRLEPQCDRVLLNANGDPERFARYELEVVADPLPGYLGPLAGILAGMEWARAHDPDAVHVVTVAADTPLFPMDLVERLQQAVTLSQPIAVAATLENGRLRSHPVFGCWPVALAPGLRKDLAVRGMRKILDWAEENGCVFADFPSTCGDPFFNVNAPSDFDTIAERMREEQ